MSKYTHPESEQTIDVSPDFAAEYENQGWVKAEPKNDAKK